MGTTAFVYSLVFDLLVVVLSESNGLVGRFQISRFEGFERKEKERKEKIKAGSYIRCTHSNRQQETFIQIGNIYTQGDRGIR